MLVDHTLFDHLSAYKFPSPVSAPPQQYNDKAIDAAKPSAEPFPLALPFNLPHESSRTMKPISSKPHNYVSSTSHVEYKRRHSPSKYPNQALNVSPRPASDSLEAARAAIDFIATLPADLVDPILIPPPGLLHSSRTTKTSQRLSRKIFHLPRRASTPNPAGSRSGTASQVSENTDCSFLLAAQSIPQWPLPPSYLPSSSNSSLVRFLNKFFMTLS
jgi:hypothetical protein